MTEERSTQLTFPCEFTFKVIGLADGQFESEVLQIFWQHFPQLGEGAITPKLSKNQKYLALTIRINAISQAQLDSVYQILSSNPLVLFAL
jgi:putative lipoic acid-binding regulatory protein